MESLFLTSYTAHFGVSIKSALNFTINTSNSYFEIEDDSNKELQIHFAKGAGMARFKNPNNLDLSIFNYDKFLTDLPHAFQQGKKRCDLILCSSSSDYILLGELKDKKPHEGNMDGASLQLLGSLKVILEVAAIEIYTNGKINKMCCYFNKQSEAPLAIVATNAFNRLNLLSANGFQMPNPAIEALGFKFFEYTGEQTVQLS
jgi:hypothetical protein